ncbi:MAG: PIN domain-containing protein [Rickettsiales bacterium]
MGIILDTCVLIAAEKQKLNFGKVMSHEEAFITAITASELLVGVKLADSEVRRTKRSAFVEHILSSFTILPFSTGAARIHSDIHSSLLRKGELIGAHDMMIAAIAMSHGYSIVTGNYREFSRVVGLDIINIEDLLAA